MNLRYEACSDETHSWIVVLVGGIGTLKTIPIGTEAGIPLHHYGFQVFI
jgi:hypothetical protein